MSAPAARAAAVFIAVAVATAPWARLQAQEARSGAPQAELDGVRAAYEYGRYSDVLQRARDAIDRGGVERDALVELHKYAGLAAFNLSQPADAERHFAALLRMNPDYALDPFAVPPPAIALFERVRRDLAPQLELIRQQLRIDAERQRRETEERDRRRREEEERRRRLEELSRRITVRTLEKRSFLVNFVPFGAGQFQQGRTTAAWILASLQGAFALTSVVAYLAYDDLLETWNVGVVDTVAGPITVTRTGIPPHRQRAANVWRLTKYASAGAFYTLYGYGVVDALYHHEDSVVSESTFQLPPEGAPPSSAPAPESPAPEGPRGFLFPTSGGIGAGFTLRF
jgi:TM2 domain-containing membrane protein YozV